MVAGDDGGARRREGDDGEGSRSRQPLSINSSSRAISLMLGRRWDRQLPTGSAPAPG